MKKLTQILGLAGLVALVLALLVGLVQQRMSAVVMIHGAAGLVLATLSGISNAPEIREFLAKRSVRMGPQVILQGLFILLILGFLNILIFRHDVVLDLTNRQFFTLSKVSEDALDSLPGEVEVMAFFPRGGPTEARQRLHLYSTYSPLVKVRFIDPDRNEDIARAENVPPQPGILFKHGKEKVWITKYAESDLTNAFIKVTRETKPLVWFSTGHAEPALDSDGPNGLLYLDQMLRQQGYRTETADLQTIDEIPEEVAMVALVGPASPLSRRELSMLDYYLVAGGNAVFFIDPVWDQSSISGLEGLIDPYGLQARWNLVFDPEHHLAEDKLGIWLVSSNLADHPVSAELTQRRVALYMTRSFTPKEIAPRDTSIQWLVKSHESSHEKFIDPRVISAMEDPDERRRYVSALMRQPPVEGEFQGSQGLVYAIEKLYDPPLWKVQEGLAKRTLTRMVVFGTSKPPRNSSIYMPYNHELIMNAFNWLAGEKDLKRIRSPRRAGTRMYLGEEQKDRILYLSVMIIPEVFMIIGLAVWWRRR